MERLANSSRISTENILSHMIQEYELGTSSNTDVIIRCAGPKMGAIGSSYAEVAAHKIVLGAVSPMLRQAMAQICPCEQATIIAPGKDLNLCTLIGCFLITWYDLQTLSMKNWPKCFS